MLPELIPTRTSEHKLGIYTLHTKALQTVPSLKGILDQLFSHKALQQMRGYMITTGEQQELYSVCSIHDVVTVKHTGQQAISFFFFFLTARSCPGSVPQKALLHIGKVKETASEPAMSLLSVQILSQNTSFLIQGGSLTCVFNPFN